MSDGYDGCDWKNTTEYDYEPGFDDPDSYSLEDQVGDVLDRVEEQAEMMNEDWRSVAEGPAVRPLTDAEIQEHEERVRRFLQGGEVAPSMASGHLVKISEQPTRPDWSYL